MDIVHPEVERYLLSLASSDDEPILLEMEQLAKDEGFPIVGRLCGRTIELLARAIGARRIFELGSGFGYSALWFARATGPSGEIHLTDLDPENERKALDFLGRAGVDGSVTFHVASALDAFAEASGDFDIVYCDIDKDGYPDAWEAARGRIRVGGMFICDNMLWSGRVTGSPGAPEDAYEGWTEAIDRTNRAIEADARYRQVIVPLRDGLIVALRIS
jgi:caffeoyl-CoA O-methyltransferase